MGQISQPDLVMPLVCAFSRHESALDWAHDRAVAHFGPVALASPRFEFHETDYYTETMGAGIRKCFWVFEQFADPAQLVDWKIMSNAWEDELAAQPALAVIEQSESRPVNVDPGYISMAKLLLASTKDYAHRIYLGRGIYAEITLFFRQNKWQSHEWTFPDYRRDDYQKFFTNARQLYKMKRPTVA
jgi:hypothetical protein